MGCPQPTLDDLLIDPLVRMVMARDGVEPDSVRDLLRDVARGLKPARTLDSAARAS